VSAFYNVRYCIAPPPPYTLAAGQPHDALEAAEACVAARPAWEKAYYRRGEARFALRNFSQAAEDFRTSQELSSAGGGAAAAPDPHLAARLAAAEEMLLDVQELDTDVGHV
jgi:tetratricopeptide (TPR) repeat protein